jgi:site-specific recombinase XerD
MTARVTPGKKLRRTLNKTLKPGTEWTERELICLDQIEAAASRAYRGTRNLRAVQVLLGHASIATTERYTAVDDSEIRAAMVAAVGD